MKFDSVFYEKLQKEVTEGEYNYKRKYVGLLIIVTILLWVGLILLIHRYSFWYVFKDGLIYLIFSAPIIIYFARKAIIAGNAERKFFLKIAEENGGTYQEKISIKREQALMFKQGSQRQARQSISFVDEDGTKIRFFKYTFKIGKTKFLYYVFGVGGLESIPHMYLNYKTNRFEMTLGHTLSLPAEFEKKYKLIIPEGYHLEALQIFTPDIISEILNQPFRCDIEFVNGEVLFYFENIKNTVRDFKKVKEQIEGARKILALIKPKIENLSWVPVGDKAFHL